MSRAGSIKKDTKAGTWYFVIDLAPPGATDRQQIKRRGFPTKVAAREAMDRVKESARRGEYVEPSRLTFGGYLREWIDGRVTAGLRDTTAGSYREKLESYVLCRPIADIRLQALTALDLDRLYTELLKSGRRTGKRAGGPLSARTVRYVHTILNGALADAQRKSLVVRNVATVASPPSASAARAPEFSVWTPEELKRFLASVAEHHHGAMFRTLAMTGLRRSEVCGLRWRDLDLDGRILSVRQRVALVGNETRVGPVKSRRSRRALDFDPRTAAALHRHRKLQLEHRMLIGAGYEDRDLVFAMPDGHEWNPESISQAFERAEARAGLPPIRLHDLRHTHATHLLAAGVNAKVVSDRLGHASVAFTLDTYAHVLPGQQADAAAAVSGLVDEEDASDDDSSTSQEEKSG